jgi:O-acetyl-ADP-ribose deacetylase (regulator of RNase III)
MFSIVEKQGDIFKSTCHFIVIPVNTIGIAGAGLAGAAHRLIPGWFEAYKKDCDDRRIVAGFSSSFYKTRFNNTDHTIINFATMKLPGEAGDLDLIYRGLHWLSKDLAQIPYVSIAYPALGCGVGRLRWDSVKALLIEHVGKNLGDVIDITAELYAPV